MFGAGSMCTSDDFHNTEGWRVNNILESTEMKKDVYYSRGRLIYVLPFYNLFSVLREFDICLMKVRWLPHIGWGKMQSLLNVPMLCRWTLYGLPFTICQQEALRQLGLYSLPYATRSPLSFMNSTLVNASVLPANTRVQTYSVSAKMPETYPFLSMSPARTMCLR